MKFNNNRRKTCSFKDKSFSTVHLSKWISFFFYEIKWSRHDYKVITWSSSIPNLHLFTIFIYFINSILFCLLLMFCTIYSNINYIFFYVLFTKCFICTSLLFFYYYILYAYKNKHLALIIKIMYNHLKFFILRKMFFYFILISAKQKKMFLIFDQNI